MGRIVEVVGQAFPAMNPGSTLPAFHPLRLAILRQRLQHAFLRLPRHHSPSRKSESNANINWSDWRVSALTGYAGSSRQRPRPVPGDTSRVSVPPGVAPHSLREASAKDGKKSSYDLAVKISECLVGALARLEQRRPD